ncbi:hypothetical protein F9C11_29720 [Amycolatopsis sp. VS8301801F10]|uniref:hypothetical protein n=1 Tax=unclassified Amycolatopsis TaxID=2618356 RepID=UPI0038FCFC16
MSTSSKISRSRAAAWIAGAAAIAGLGLAAAPAAASAAPQTAPTAVVDHAKPTQVCFVNGYNVNFRTGPGITFPSRGTVNKGQGFDVVGRSGNWSEGHLWGPDYNSLYWIASKYLDC